MVAETKILIIGASGLLGSKLYKIFLKDVENAKRSGVAKIKETKVIGIEEKPEKTALLQTMS
ncbi:MAG: hypothetical protein Q7U96_05975 [Chloroflexota bacterium]|nr:hypothetical protein [Chloroflexota bacterium]